MIPMLNKNYFGEIDNVVLEEYNSGYPSKYLSEIELLKQIISSPARYHHIGSTAVPGMFSKPVIDIAIELEFFPLSQIIIDQLQITGYIFWDKNPANDHQFLFKNLPRTHHLHLYPMNSQQVIDKITFRDILISNYAIRQEYQDLKIRLAAKYPNDREKYTINKTYWIKSVLQKG